MKPPENKKEIIELYEQGPVILEQALDGLKDNELDYSPSMGGWTIREIVHHLADGDDLWKIAIKMALGDKEDEFTLQWYAELSQVEWAERWGYEKRPVDISIALLMAIRKHILQLLDNVEGAWNKSVKFLSKDGKIEILPVGFIIKMQGDHVVHHVTRIEEIRYEISGN